MHLWLSIFSMCFFCGVEIKTNILYWPTTDIWTTKISRLAGSGVLCYCPLAAMSEHDKQFWWFWRQKKFFETLWNGQVQNTGPPLNMHLPFVFQWCSRTSSHWSWTEREFNVDHSWDVTIRWRMKSNCESL